MTTKDLILRITDGLIGAFWLAFLIRSLTASRIGGTKGFIWSRAERPVAYWASIAFLALMVLHFIGLAIVGQMRG